MSKKVYVYGFTKNAFVFMQPALRYILGQNQFNYVGSIEQACKTLSQADVICVNCHYMMIRKSQKEFQLDFGFKSLSTAATHWNMVLQKFDVVNLYELRTKFR